MALIFHRLVGRAHERSELHADRLSGFFAAAYRLLYITICRPPFMN
jgi:hypothetical protein